MSDGEGHSTPEEFEEVAGLLRERRPTISALELDGIKTRALARARHPRQTPTLRGRVLVALLAVGLMAAGTGGVIAAGPGGGGGGTQAAQSQYRPPHCNKDQTKCKCPDHSQPVPGGVNGQPACACPGGSSFNGNGNDCKCPTGEKFDDKTQMCVPKGGGGGGPPPPKKCHDHCAANVDNSQCHDHCYGSNEPVCHDHCFGSNDPTCHDHCTGNPPSCQNSCNSPNSAIPTGPIGGGGGGGDGGGSFGGGDSVAIAAAAAAALVAVARRRRPARGTLALSGY